MSAKQTESSCQILSVLVAAPVHAGLPAVLSYLSEQTLAVGRLVRVPFGRRQVLGIVWGNAEQAPTLQDFGRLPVEIKKIDSVLEAIEPMNTAWQKLVVFAARYYQRSAGEVALSSLPPQLRELEAAQWAKKLKKQAKNKQAIHESSNPAIDIKIIAPSADQTAVLSQFFDENRPLEQAALLLGVTGSGKTEVYLRCIERTLQESPKAQILVMVPEINLTPALEHILRARFPQQEIVSMHSSITPARRLDAWLAAHQGNAQIVLTTRLGIFASLPHLQLIVVDEEHDPSYRSGDGARHSARDLAVMRAKIETDQGRACRVILGSATPSLESWQAATQGRYLKLEMLERIGSALLPELKLANMRQEPRGSLFAKPLLTALNECMAKNQQALIFLNRRGYAPMLTCDACGWRCACPNCSAYRVFHKPDRSLRCHHCGLTERVPRACPECGNIDIAPVGRGTQKIEEQLECALAQNCLRQDGSPARILRIDADSTRFKGSLQAELAKVHRGEIDILVGTQMVTKGHDFRRIGLVAAIDADAALFSSDFRAPERLFSLLMQAAGRAGRDESSGQTQMWVQTRHPDHPLFKFLAQHDYTGFAAHQLKQREQAMLPPFSFQALLRSEARSQEAAQEFLNVAKLIAETLIDERITVFPPVPMSMQRIANIERAQMLIESSSRAALQGFLARWLPLLKSRRPKGLIRFALDVDPILI